MKWYSNDLLNFPYNVNASFAQAFQRGFSRISYEYCEKLSEITQWKHHENVSENIFWNNAATIRQYFLNRIFPRNKIRRTFLQPCRNLAWKVLWNVALMIHWTFHTMSMHLLRKLFKKISVENYMNIVIGFQKLLHDNVVKVFPTIYFAIMPQPLDNIFWVGFFARKKIRRSLLQPCRNIRM